MPEKHLLIFPTPTRIPRAKLGSGVGTVHHPTAERQAVRLTPKFEGLQQSFEDEAHEVRTTAAGVEPEQVIVLDTIGSIKDFANAVRRIPGMEWMAEWDEVDIRPDEDFYKVEDDEEDHEASLSGRLFLVMSNQDSLRQLQSLWTRYVANPDSTFDYGLAKFKNVFNYLKDVRRWGPEDRLRETGVLESWRESLEYQQDPIRFEAEIWYRQNPTTRVAAYNSFSNSVREVGGTCLAQCIIPEIAYHGVVVELSARNIEAILSNAETRMIRSHEVMFFRPVGQCSSPLSDEEPREDGGAAPHGLPTGDPVVALLDGLPQENHARLAGRIAVDDPEDWAATYPVADRQHGTAMASLIVWGDLEANEAPLPRPVYVRPIMQPNPHSNRQPRDESMPEDHLPADLVHHAVLRMLRGSGDVGPTAPRVRVINISVCDRGQPFDVYPSAWARLLDWLSWEYKVLFIVSAGNHPRDIVLDLPRAGLAVLDPAGLKDHVLKALSSDCRHRRLLSPSEGINPLTVGATHEDGSVVPVMGHRFDPLEPGLPSPYNALGLGFRRSVKPEVLLPGGRQFYRERLGNTHEHATLEMVGGVMPPGQKVACPSTKAGNLTGTKHARGTSNATAVASRTAALLYEQLVDLQSAPGGETLHEDYFAVLLKTMLVHGASWGDAISHVDAALRNGEHATKFKATATRFLGFGVADPSRVFECESHRATVIGCGSLKDGQGHEFLVPLPPSLSGRKTWRRLTISLGWMTPINPQHNKYRRAALWFDASTDKLRAGRRETDWQTARRGTVQHEVFDGEDASVFGDGDNLRIGVNCRSDAGSLQEPVPYALALTLEVAEGVGIDVYEEIRVRLRAPISV